MILYKLEQMWDNIPTVDDLSSKYKLSALWIRLLIFILTIFIIFLPSMIAHIAGYWTTLIIAIASLIAWNYLIIIVVKSESYKIYKRVMYTILVLYSIFSCLNLFIEFPKSQPDKFNNDTTYVTYDHTCPYCRKATLPLNASVNLYNRFNSKKIVMVDLTQDTSLTKELKKRITYKGTIINISKNKQGTYTLRGQDKKPRTPSPEYIWKLLKTYND